MSNLLEREGEDGAFLTGCRKAVSIGSWAVVVAIALARLI
jgi:hypothetical protein